MTEAKAKFSKDAKSHKKGFGFELKREVEFVEKGKIKKKI